MELLAEEELVRELLAEEEIVSDPLGDDELDRESLGLEEIVSDPLAEDELVRESLGLEDDKDSLAEGEDDKDSLGTEENVEWTVLDTDELLVINGLLVKDPAFVAVILIFAVLEYDSCELDVILLPDVFVVETDPLDERVCLGLTEVVAVLTAVRVFDMHAE
jgi:hypothetical protein